MKFAEWLRQPPLVVLAHVEKCLLEQGQKSTEPEDEFFDGSGCKYRDNNGNKCAIGHLIDNSEYNLKLEGGLTGVIRGLTDSRFAEGFLNSVGSNFLRQLQGIHDGVPVEKWKNAFQELRNSSTFAEFYKQDKLYKEFPTETSNSPVVS